MKPLGVVVLGEHVLWIRGTLTRPDAAYLMHLWITGKAEVRKGTDLYERPFEEFGHGMRQIGVEGGRPGVADWVIVLADPPAHLLSALVAGALKLHRRGT